jgi:cysteine desulfurase / selenocysteine lyase
MAAHDQPVHVITSVLEHNSVLRPLYELKRAGSVDLSILPVDNGYLDPDLVADSIGKGTTLAILNHGSNVIGTVQDLPTISSILQEEGAFVVVDGSQTAGHIPISLGDLPVDAFVFTGHKALFGITGTGGFVIRNPEEVAPVRVGGTGSNSSSLYHPRDLPERFEAGTHNYPGLAALSAGITYIRDIGLSSIEQKGKNQVSRIIDVLSGHPGDLNTKYKP